MPMEQNKKKTTITIETLKNEVAFNNLNLQKTRVYLVVCRNTGIVGFIITDGKNTLKLGDYVDSCEDREEVEMRQDWLENTLWRYGNWQLFITQDGVVVKDSVKLKTLYESICGRRGFLLESPVYVGNTTEGKYFLFDCLASGFHIFNSKDELKEKLSNVACTQHDRPLLHWLYWYIVRNGDIVTAKYNEPYLEEILSIIEQL